MAAQTILWIPLPGGFIDEARTRARLSVFVSPQLQPDRAETLEAFDFRDWPSRLVSGRLTFTVQFDGKAFDASISGAPESRLWTALFTPATFVRPHQRVRTSAVFGSYPAARLHQRLRGGYQRLGAGSPIEPAAPPAIAAAFDDVHRALTAPASRANANATERARLAGTVLAASRRDLPALGDRLVDLAQIEVERRRANNEASEFVPIVQAHDDAASLFEQFVIFQQQPRGTARPTRVNADTRLDFHQLVASLGEYPELMRLLGLLITLELDAAEVPLAALDTPGRVRVRPKFTAPLDIQTRHVTPATAYSFVPDRLFIASPEPGGAASRETVAGLLDLRLQVAADDNEPQFQILQVDVDTAAQRTIDLLMGLPTGGASPEGRDHHLPPLRSGGISIARHGHARFIHGAIATGQDKVAALLSGIDVPLFAEDLIRGYRIDVFDDMSKTWHSLHERSGKYEFPTLSDTRTLVDEGSAQPCFVQPASEPGEAPASQPDPTAATYISESLFLWNGWSLSATRPGKPLPQPATAPPPPPPGGPPPSAPPQTLPLKTTFTVVPRSLPRLRFGRAYTFRGRMVDLGGQSLSSRQATEVMAGITPAPVLPAAGEEFRFQRFEVIGPPAVLARSAPADGESVERIVVRSPGRVSARQERHIAPPKTWPLMAEMLGLFDSAIGTGTNTKEMLALASRVEGAFAEGPHPEEMLVLPYLPDPLAAGVTFRDLPGVAKGTVGRVRDGRLGFTPISLPAASLAQIGSIALIDFGPASSWPNLLPFRLRVAGGTSAPEWDEAARVLTVFLDTGATATVRMSCHLRNPTDLSLLGVANWIEREMEASSGDVDAFREQTLLGLSWMVTPYRELTLVHAVQRPVAPPAIAAFPQPIKLIDQTFAHIRGTVQVHGASTGRLELIAEWTERGDDLDSLTKRPEPRPFRAQVFPSPFHLSASAAPIARAGSIPEAVFDEATDTVEYLAPRIEHFDAQFHDLSATLARLKSSAIRTIDRLLGPLSALHTMVEDLDIASLDEVVQLSPLRARWSEIAPLADTLRDRIERIFDQAGERPPPDQPEGFALVIPDSVRDGLKGMQATATQMIATMNEALSGLFRGRHEFGDTKHRRVTYRAVGTTRFADAFPVPAVGTLDLTATSGPVEVSVLSSAAPPPPGVRHVVPAFAWTRSAPDAVTRERRRQGGILRVYLERPWFASGEGELLAVVLGPDPSAPGFDRMEPYVSRWGRDPLWRAPASPNALRPEHFRNAAVVREGMTPQDSDAPATVTLVAYSVSYDDDGQCFADIEMDAGGSYFPFVRLALARFQPQSIPSVEMSRVARADFAQLTPDRSVTVVERAVGVFAVAVSGATHASPSDPNLSTGRSGTEMRVTVQSRIPGTMDDIGWLPAPEPAVIPEPVANRADVLWKGQIRLPVGAPAGHFRVLVEEIELHSRLDVGADGAHVSTVARVVFADSFEL
jgi:hypothetical protein